MKKRFVAFFMTTVILMMSHTVSAANIQDDLVSPQWTYVYSISVALTPNGYIGAETSLEGFYDFCLTLELQEDTGTKWSTIETWTTEGNLSGGVEDYCDLDSSTTYRAKATVEVYNSLGRVVETVSITSDSV